jgi:hypothetical protein
LVHAISLCAHFTAHSENFGSPYQNHHPNSSFVPC